MPGHRRPALRIDEEVEVAIGPITVAGHLAVPDHADGLVIFAHGSGSSRHSSRNRYVAEVLTGRRFATLLFDLLTSREAGDRANVFDVTLLADRLTGVAAWARRHESLAGLRQGYFGASTGAAAALWAAAETDADVAAIVSRGGRPDLAGPRLAQVRAPTLLIVGGNDTDVLDLNRQAQGHLTCENRLDVIPRATHLFEEPGALEVAAGLARDWFAAHVAGP